MKNVEFCEVCGKPMVPSETDNIWKCVCGFTKESKSLMYATEKIKNEKVGEGIVKDSDSKGGFPHKCRKCGFALADVEVISAFYSDESDISLYKCKKCGHVERETDGTSNAF